MSLLTSIVDLDCIQVDPGKGGFDPENKSTEIEAIAHSIAELEGLVRIPVVKPLDIDEYELVDGYLEYYAYEAARKLNPNLPDRITVFVMKPSNEEAILEQLEVDRRISQIKDPSNSTKTDGELALRISNLESRVKGDFDKFGSDIQDFRQQLRDELTELINSKLPQPLPVLPLLEAFNRVSKDGLVRDRLLTKLKEINCSQRSRVIESLQIHVGKGQQFKSFNDVLSCLGKGVLSKEKMLELIDAWKG